MTDFNQNHPELEAGEHFLTNTERENVPKLRRKYSFHTLRMGRVAYAEDGRRLLSMGLDNVPVFWKPKPSLTMKGIMSFITTRNKHPFEADLKDAWAMMLERYRSPRFKIGGSMEGRAFGIDIAISDPAPMKVEYTLPTFKSDDLKEIRPKAELSISANNCHAIVITVGGKEYIVSHKQFLRAAKVICEDFC